MKFIKNNKKLKPWAKPKPYKKIEKKNLQTVGLM